MASILIWMMINLSKQYTTILTYDVVYDKLPQDKILQEAPLKILPILVRANGFELLSAKFTTRTIKIISDKLRKKSETNYFLLLREQKMNIQKQLKSSLVLEEVLQDTLHLKLGRLATKKVTVIPKVEIDYKVGYALAKGLVITPNIVIVSGPDLQLSKIENLSTEKIIMNNVSESFTKTVRIVLPENVEKVKLSHAKVEIKALIDKFTEGEVEVPVIVENIPAGIKINTFPKTVKIRYKIGLKDFSKIDSGLFSVVCDYRQSKENELNYLIPVLKDKPNLVSSVRIGSEKIDFLIVKE